MSALVLRWSILLPGVIGALHAQTHPASFLGNGWGLDHVMIALPNSESAKGLFGAKLGFTVAPSNSKFPEQGLDHALITLPPAYLELLWPYQDAANRDGPLLQVRRKAESGGGATDYNIDVSPAEGAADFLRRLGMTVTLPRSVTRIVNGKEQPGTSQFLQVETKRETGAPSGVPGGEGVGFLEYPNNSDRLRPERFREQLERVQKGLPDSRRQDGEIHANTARRLRSVWVAATSISDAVKRSELFGFTPGSERQLAVLSARGREVQCGQGTIVFWEPIKQDGTLSALVKKQGPGLFGVSIEVADLTRAHDIAERGTQSKLAIEHQGDRASFVVPADLAGGTWIEFVQQLP